MTESATVSGTPCPHCGNRQWAEGWIKSFFTRVYWKKPDRFLLFEIVDDPPHPEALACTRCGYVVLWNDPTEFAALGEG